MEPFDPRIHCTKEIQEAVGLTVAEAEVVVARFQRISYARRLYAMIPDAVKNNPETRDDAEAIIELAHMAELHPPAACTAMVDENTAP